LIVKALLLFLLEEKTEVGEVDEEDFEDNIFGLVRKLVELIMIY